MRRQRQAAVTASPAAANNSSTMQTRQVPGTQQKTPAQLKQAPEDKPVSPQKAAPVKPEPVTPAPPPNPPQETPPAVMDSESADPNDSETGTEGTGKRPRWFTSTKKPSVRAKERKIRQNRRLRKILIPKNALMALHELKGITMSEFVINSRTEGGFSAKVTVNNMQYEGIGNSKTAAKNNACEKALRDHIIYKMISSIRKKSTAEATDNEEQDVEMKESEEDTESKLLKEEEDVPMLNLASFALFKLFTEWESEGFEIPEFRQANTNANGVAPPAPAPIKHDLPPNHDSMHPASLLCIMRPGIQYTYLGGEGSPPNTVQRVGVCVDAQNFIGEGRSQKVARRNAAIKACNALFNTSFAAE